MPCLLYVHMYIVTCTCPRLEVFAQKGDPNGPLFYLQPCGVFYPSTWVEGSLMYILYIVPAALSVLPSPTRKGTRTVPFSLRYYRCSPLRPVRGPERSPFLLCPAGHFISSTWSQEQERITFIFGPRVHSIVYIFQKKTTCG